VLCASVSVTAEQEALSEVTQLILRDRGVVALTAACSGGLVHLASLSLSHNRVASLEGWCEPLGSLAELNLNFNQLRNLDGLCAPTLKKLCLSSNQLGDAALRGLGQRFPHLVSLGLFRNNVRDLPAALAELRRLPRLAELDLDGNPCSQANPGTPPAAVTT
jgi:Leucine-rich repeat (LRR) protein